MKANSRAGSISPVANDRSIARPDPPRMSVMTVASLILARLQQLVDLIRRLPRVRKAQDRFDNSHQIPTFSVKQPALHRMAFAREARALRPTLDEALAVSNGLLAQPAQPTIPTAHRVLRRRGLVFKMEHGSADHAVDMEPDDHGFARTAAGNDRSFRAWSCPMSALR